MYKYACRDLGVDCNFSATGETFEEVKNAVFAHAGVVHKDELASMTPEQLRELEMAVDEAIKPV